MRFNAIVRYVHLLNGAHNEYMLLDEHQPMHMKESISHTLYIVDICRKKRYNRTGSPGEAYCE